MAEERSRCAVIGEPATQATDTHFDKSLALGCARQPIWRLPTGNEGCVTHLTYLASTPLPIIPPSLSTVCHIPQGLSKSFASHWHPAGMTRDPGKDNPRLNPKSDWEWRLALVTAWATTWDSMLMKDGFKIAKWWININKTELYQYGCLWLRIGLQRYNQ